jgi:NADH:quinone reductase (non-electrogenic)
MASGTRRPQAQVVVVGAGYAGLMAALRTARRARHPGVGVTLVNPSDRFTERLRMHQLATGQRLGHMSIPELVAGTGICFVQGWAVGIDAGSRRILVERDGQPPCRLAYDYLIYALGSRANTCAVPGASHHALTLDTPATCARLAERLAGLHGQETVTVCGNGLTGIETAAEIAEAYPGLRVILAGRDEPAAMMGPGARRYLLAALARLGVEVRSGVEVTKVLPDAVELGSAATIPAAACVWTTGFWASPLAGDAGLRVDERGRIVFDDTLRSVSHPEVLAVGDSAAVSQHWGQIHGTCQSGVPTAIHAADTIARLLKDKKTKPFRFGYIHQPVSLGRRDGVIQFAKPDDTPRRFFLTGKAAARYKETVTASPPHIYRASRKITLPRALLIPRGGRATRKPRPPYHVSTSSR